ncbi:unnamed protein product [Closterium sp. NIES-53]
MEGQDDNYVTTSDIASLRTDMEQTQATLRRLEAFLTSQPGFATAAVATTATAAPTTPAAVATPTFHGPMAPLSPNLEAGRPRLLEAFDPSAKGSDVRRFVATLEINFEAIGCSTPQHDATRIRLVATVLRGPALEWIYYTDYTQQMELLFNRITDLTEGEKIQAYTEGLKMEIRRQVIAANYNSYRDIVRAAERYDALTRGQPETRRFTPNPCKDDVSHWDTQLPTLEFAYNNASHAATGKTPFFLCYGREPLTPQQPTTPAHVQAAHDFVTTMKQLWEKTQRRLTMMQNSQKQYADRQRRDHSVAVGDQVLLDMRNLNLSHLPSKLRPRFCGPFLVEAQVTPVTFRLRLPDTWKHHNAFHVQLLKPYKDPNQQFQGRQLPPPPPVLIQHEPEYEVERVLTHRRRGGKTLEFLLRWKGYDRTEDSWVAEADMGNARRALKDYLVKQDKKAMIALCQEHRLEHQTKPIALWYFLARDLQQRGQLRLAYMATRANTAGVFTKALPPSDHQRFATVLGLLALLFLTGPMTTCAWGGWTTKWQSSDLVELVHMDLVGPMKVKGGGGALYSMTMVDDYTRLTWSFPLANKSDAARVIIEEWLPMVEQESGKRVKAIRSDRGGEFLRAELRSWLKQHGIKQQLTTAYTPRSNGVAERANRTIIEGGKTILVDSGLPLRFWPLAICHATVIKNRKPLMDMLRVFGCMGLVHVPKEKRDKLQAPVVWAVHLGLARGSKGWLMWDPKSNTIFTTRDAKFMEGLMFKEWSERGRSKVTIPLGIEVGTNDPLHTPIEFSSSSELTEVSHDLGGAEGEAANVEGVLQQGEAPIAERGDTEEKVQQPTPSPKLPPRRTTQGKRDVVRGGAKEGAAKERPKRAAHPRDFLKYERHCWSRRRKMRRRREPRGRWSRFVALASTYLMS